MHFAGYSSTLNKEQKEIYQNKLLRLKNIGDPYEIPFCEFEKNPSLLPQIEHGDIVNYLVFSTHSFTLEQMKSFKSLEAHNYFTSGWVSRKVLFKEVLKHEILFLGEVKHSQSLSSQALKVWILSNKNGEIVTAHCSCMAGFGESCSHIGALLFAVESKVKLLNTRSCTDDINMWLAPQLKNNSPFLRVEEIDFTSAKGRKRKFDNFVISGAEKEKSFKVNSIPNPSESETMDFLQKVAATGVPAAILSVTPGLSENFIIKSKPHHCVKLMDLFSEENIKLSWDELIDLCKKTFCSEKFSISGNTVAEIEVATKEQSKSMEWYLYRAGRITASNMKSVCHTDPHKPSLSLINRICYPKKGHKTQAMVWGCDHEQTALNSYVTKNQDHSSFSVEPSGFHIHKENSFIGATPDALINCDCCGKGICEIKCPFCSKDEHIYEFSLKKKSCLVLDELENINLDRSHAYYYQIQSQLFACDVDFCDFVVWTENDLHIERIYQDQIFWENVLEKATNFYLRCILPELMGKWYSRHAS